LHNYAIAYIGLKFYFKDYLDLSIVANVGDLLMLKDYYLQKNNVLDLELKGISGISEPIYGPYLIKVHKRGMILSEGFKKNLMLMEKRIM
jgi:hypothetical protein